MIFKGSEFDADLVTVDYKSMSGHIAKIQYITIERKSKKTIKLLKQILVDLHEINKLDALSSSEKVTSLNEFIKEYNALMKDNSKNGFNL